MSGSNSGFVAYNPGDPLQNALLAGITQAETGSTSNPFLGAGSTTGAVTDLSTAPQDQYGFPIWQGWGGSHGAGLYQFEPGTWASVASKFGLNFNDPAQQSAGAWYLAQQVYQQKTGGDLYSALQNGDYGSVQQALQGTWAAGGNAAEPAGLASTISSDLASGVTAPGAGESVAPVDSGSFDTSTGGGGNTSLTPIYNSQGQWIGYETGGSSSGGDTSASDNAANATFPQGGIGGSGTASGTGTDASTGATFPAGGSSALGLSGLLGAITDWVLRGGLIFVGVAIIFVALWMLLGDQGYVPGPKKLAKGFI